MKKIITFLLLSITIQSYSQELKFGKVTAAEINEKFHPLDTTVNAAYLYKYRRTYYSYNQSEGFLVTTDFHERIKIYTKEGLDYANKTIAYYNSKKSDKEKVTAIKGYTFNIEKGKIVKEKLSSKQVFDDKKSKSYSLKKIAMPAVKIGSVIDIKYQLISPFHTSIDDLEFQFAIPVKSYIAKIEIPEYYIFRKNTKGYYSIYPKISSSNGTIDFTSKYRAQGRATGTTFQTSTSRYKIIEDEYIATNIPALEDNEPFVSSVENYRGGISYEISAIQYPNDIPKYYSTTWEDVSKKIHKFSGFGLELDKKSYFKKVLPTVLTNTNSDLEKLNAIFEFVKSKIKWNGYYGKYTDLGVRKAYMEGVGNVADINLLLTSMLREGGLDANPVLLSSKNNGQPLFPTMNGFNYVISHVKFPDGTYALLDATERYSSPNILPFRALNWKGRLVTKEGNSSWIELTPSKKAIATHIVHASITPDNAIEGLQRSKYMNSYALNYRIKNNKLKEEVVITNLEENYNIEVEEFKISDLKKLSKPVTRTIKFTKDDLIEEINGKLYVNPLLFLATTENPFKSEERNFPVDFTTPWQEKNTVSLVIPDGYKVTFLPESMAIGMPDNLGFFKFITKQVGNKITVQCIMQFNTSLIAPQYYATLKEFYGDLVAKQSEKIIFAQE